MKLEDALQIIDEVKVNEGIASYSPIKISSEEILREIYDSMTGLIINQRSFYSNINLLDDWAKSELPNPADYGSDAKKWVWHEKHVITSLIPLILGGVVSAVAGPLENMFFLGLGTSALMYGGVGINISRFKIRELEFEEGVREYINDLVKFKNQGDVFIMDGLDNLGSSIDNYMASLEKFSWILRKQKYAQKDIGILDFEKDKVSAFSEKYVDLIKTISKSKKGPLPSWSPALKCASISVISGIHLGQIKSSLEDINNVGDLSIKYLLGPKLVLVE